MILFKNESEIKVKLVGVLSSVGGGLSLYGVIQMGLIMK